MQFDYLVFIGRFQPFHRGHQAVVEKALSSSRQVIILVGSSNVTRTLRNPFTFEERRDMILGDFSWAENRLIIKPIDDHTYQDEAWLEQIYSVIESCVPAHNAYAKIGLIGHKKDNTSFYLNMFPKLDSVEVDNPSGLSATELREDLFSGSDSLKLKQDLSATVYYKVIEWVHTKPDLIALHNEYEFVKQYKKQWKNTPYPVIFSTVDAVVIQSGHVLLIKRKSMPGEGKWALPGGFLEQDETIAQGTIRELRQETKLKVPEPVLTGSIVDRQVFDDIHRSSRGRTITHATYFKLKDSHELPKVKGSDDAKEAKWVLLSSLKASDLFEDHYFIIRKFIP